MRAAWLTNSIVFLDDVTEKTGKVISWLTLLMVLLTFTIVVLRYGFNLGWIAMQESVLYFHGIVFMLGAAYTLKADGHVRVDIFYQMHLDFCLYLMGKQLSLSVSSTVVMELL